LLLQDDEINDEAANKADKKKREKASMADAKEVARETKRLLDIEKAEAAKLAAEDAADGK